LISPTATPNSAVTLACTSSSAALAALTPADLVRGIAAADGADGVILGCTELSLILSQADMVVPVFDTTSMVA
jgi:aspartate/glutamate racemase